MVNFDHYPIEICLRCARLIESGQAIREDHYARRTQERWRVLAEQASVEKDPNKLMDLVKEIDEILTEKQDRPNRLPLDLSANLSE